MNSTRQDAWSKDEDVLLAETVLRYIREGKTQLEAFKEVAKKLSRTSAACGFRWNATIRKQYQDAIQFAKESRKQNNQNNVWQQIGSNHKENDPIDTAILLLKKMKISSAEQGVQAKEEEIEKLRKENKKLKEMLIRYEEAWEEMGKLWQWVREKEHES